MPIVPMRAYTGPPGDRLLIAYPANSKLIFVFGGITGKTAFGTPIKTVAFWVEADMDNPPVCGIYGWVKTGEPIGGEEGYPGTYCGTAITGVDEYHLYHYPTMLPTQEEMDTLKLEIAKSPILAN